MIEMQHSSFILSVFLENEEYMLIHWHEESIISGEKSTRHLFDTQADIAPDIGSNISLRNYSIPKGLGNRFYKVTSIFHVLTVNNIPIDSIQFQTLDPVDRFEEAIQYIKKNLGGHLINLDKDKRRFVYSLHEIEVIVKEDIE